VSEDTFQTILDDHDWLLDSLMARYSLVVHLESAAIDTQLYDQLASNNAARHESEEEARLQDLATQKAWASHPNVVMIRNCACGEDFEKKKQLAVTRVLEHLNLAAVSSASSARRLFLLHCHPPTSLFDQPHLKCDSFTIESTFLRHVAGQSQHDRVIERRGRPGGVWTYTLSYAIPIAANGDTAESKPKNYIDEVRIGGRMYTGLLAERDEGRRPVRRRERVFTHYVPAAGRDVVHRLVEVLNLPAATSSSSNGSGANGSVASDASAVNHEASSDLRAEKKGPLATMKTRKSLTITSLMAAATKPEAAEGGGGGGGGRGGGEDAAVAASMEAGVEHLEFLYVDGLEAGTQYEPPAFLAPFIREEVVEKADRERYSLRALSTELPAPA